MQARGERALQLAWRHGLRAVRSHIDSLGPGAACSWEALIDLRQQWRDRLELQLVALVPVEHWATPMVRNWQPRLLRPMEPSVASFSLLVEAGTNDRACDGCWSWPISMVAVDLHIDEASSHPAAGMRQLLRVMEAWRCLSR